MNKKQYVKPEFKMVALCAEERLAACENYYKSGFGYPGCHDKFFPNDEPATCTLTINPVGVS